MPEALSLWEQLGTVLCPQNVTRPSAVPTRDLRFARGVPEKQA